MRINIVSFAVPMETQASFSPSSTLEEKYADITSEQAERLMGSITDEVRFLGMVIVKAFFVH